MKLNNKIFIETTKIEDIPWELLEGPYERCTDFPQWITSLTGKCADHITTGKEKIALNFEHQETLWSVTPFIMLILRKTLNEVKNPVKIVAILDLYEIIYKIANAYLKIYKEKNEAPLPHFSDMLKEKNLFPPISIYKDYYDDEELLSEEYHENIPDELFISFYYYSWLILAYSINYDFPQLKEFPDDSVKERLKKFENKSLNLLLNDLLINLS
ncbi:MAG: hypothetical protein LBU74_03135 [Methanobacteriaceae archaeon]|jgi:hypothetical protein|nr:hypothetical protein [Candidatus Methanorudis spinitermitis]